jgi:chemosensory pili system protein ChpA (sensor histidine kinase/response regulator)
VPGEGEPAAADTGAIESIQPVESAPVVEDEADAAHDRDGRRRDLTMADDLSPYLDASALPVDDRDAEEMPVLRKLTRST